MRRRDLTIMAAATILAFPRLAPAQTDSARGGALAAPEPMVVLISIDGLRPEYVLAADGFGLRVPHLRRIARQGTYAEGVRGVLPTVTYPSHTTLLTGASPSAHGIAGNTTFDPQQKNQSGWYWYASDIRVPTLWDATHERGLTTASVHWPVSVGAPVTFNLPQIWRTGMPDDRKLVRALSTPGLLDRMEQALGAYPDGIDESIEADERRAVFAGKLIRDQRPALVTAYFTALDHEQHAEGPLTRDNAKAKAVLERIDKIVGSLVAAAITAASDSATIVIVSDHGFASTTREVHLLPLLAEAGLIDVDSTGKISDWRAGIWPTGGTIAIVARDSADLATRAAIRRLANRIRADTSLGAQEVLAGAELGRQRGFPGADAVVLLRPGFTSGSQTRGKVVRPSSVKGMHGHHPDLAEMRSSFFMMGRGAAVGRSLGEVDMRIIAPTVARLLGVTLGGAELRPLAAAASQQR